jgi:hypothetical protein
MENEKTSKTNLEGGFRSRSEQQVGEEIERVFSKCPDSVEIKLQNFTKYIRRQNLTRMLALYELFKRVLPVKGSVVECGVHRGFGLMAWANMSAVLEPVNLTRRIYGFDTFEGFPSVADEDKTHLAEVGEGGLYADSYEELTELVSIYDANRFLGHVNKVKLIKGDAVSTIPEFLEEHPHLVVSLLFLDFDLYEPTKAAIEQFFPRIPKGGIIAFDELDNPLWPGETLALLDTVGINRLRIERMEFDPYIGYAVVD